jgi:SSS family solute:Na+ symporter
MLERSVVANNNMTAFDWFIVIGLNTLVFGFAAFWSLKTKSDVDWFLGGRSLPFWLVGMSMFATSVDGGEYVSINGVTYRDGMSMLVGPIFGVGVGGIIAAFLVVPTLYRGGFFTNAEYLESRFGVSVRVISVLVQIQYRTAVVAMIVVALHLMLTEVADLNGTMAWIVIVGLALATTLYAGWGGLSTVAATDLLLGSIMLTATLTLWFVISNEVGGWSGAEQALIAREGAETTSMLMRIGVQRDGASVPVVGVVGWILIATGYFVVNHTQTMKLLGARSLWDLQMSVVVGIALIMISGYFSSTLGVFGRALMPSLERADLIYPRLVNQYLATGVKGLVVAGMVASSASTFEGIGAALSALFTRDLYARLLVQGASDKHYLNVGRVTTVASVALSFAYVPFVLHSRSIVDWFVRLTSVFVTPLLTVYLVGVLTRVDRRSGLVGLVAGSTYGLLAITLGGTPDEPGRLPYWFTEKFASYSWSLGITSASMLLSSLLFGGSPQETADAQPATGWLGNSQRRITEIRQAVGPTPWWCQPGLWATVVLLFAAYRVFVVLW